MLLDIFLLNYEFSYFSFYNRWVNTQYYYCIYIFIKFLIPFVEVSFFTV